MRTYTFTSSAPVMPLHGLPQTGQHLSKDSLPVRQTDPDVSATIWNR